MDLTSLWQESGGAGGEGFSLADEQGQAPAGEVGDRTENVFNCDILSARNVNCTDTEATARRSAQ